MVENLEDLRKQYLSQKEDYGALCVEIKKQVEHTLKERGIKLGFDIEYRVKEWDSIVDKIQKYNMEIKEIREVNDLAGIRIVTLFKRDIEHVCSIIEGIFVSRRKEDTQERLNDNEFGYGSIHYEVTVPTEWASIPTHQKLVGLYAEIQVRTGTQHIWAASSHLLQYKNQIDVPPPLRRTINRVAALLETVDLEFERVLIERHDYIDNKKAQADDLNVDTLRILLDAKLPQANKRTHIQEQYSEMISELSKLGISRVSQLSELIDRRFEEAMEAESKAIKSFDRSKSRSEELIDRVDRGVYFTFSGLIRGMLKKEFGHDKVVQIIDQVKKEVRSEM